MARMHDRRRHCHPGFGTQPTRSHIQCLQGTLSAAAVSAISIDPAEQPCWQRSQSLGPQPFPSLTLSNDLAVRRALETAGVEFTQGDNGGIGFIICDYGVSAVTGANTSKLCRFLKRKVSQAADSAA